MITKHTPAALKFNLNENVQENNISMTDCIVINWHAIYIYEGIVTNQILPNQFDD